VKLNLGSGQNTKQGFINVDKFGNPDVLHDLEQFPWPWDDNSVDEVLMNHVLEHLGESFSVFIGILKELYRICKPDARITIIVPHPRHDDFLTDPTHVRAIMPSTFALFSKALNRQWAEKGAANSPLALYHDVDFRVESTRLALESPWREQFNEGQITVEQLNDAVRKFNNVVKEMEIILRVVK
jgi:predicted SAM-dependent methyltransferase